MSEPSLEHRIDADMVRGLYAQTPAAVLIGLLGGALVVAGLWATAGPPILIWYGVQVANHTVRLLLWRRFRQEPAELPQPRRWARRYAWSMLVSGIIFGSPAILFFPEHDVVRQWFIVAAVYAMATGSTMANAYHPAAMFAYLIPAVLPAALRLALQEGVVYGIFAFVLALQVPLVILFGLSQYRLLRESIRIRHQNEALIRELNERREAAEQASVAKSQFFAAASHDLRQPLHALGLFAASLRESYRGAGDARRIDQILSSVDALESLFDELLDISRLDAGQVKANLAHVPLSQVFGRLETVYAPLAERAGLKLRFARTGAVLHTDPILLERVLANLISNAVRYTERGGVLVGLRRRGADRVIEVHDTGIGIAENQRERIFEEFVQLGNPERDRKRGLGLGLATVRRICGLLGSTISVGSAVGRGSVFRFAVPAGDPVQVRLEPEAPREIEVDALAGRVVVVVDDEAAVRDGMTSLFAQWHCTVIAAGEVEESLAELEARNLRPEIIVADYRLRGHRTGRQAIERLRASYGADTPALLISGDTTPEMFRIAREAGLLLLTKPVRAARLRAALVQLLRANVTNGVS